MAVDTSRSTETAYYVGSDAATHLLQTNPSPRSRPRHLATSDRDDKFGASFDHVAKGVGIRVIKIAARAPDMNAVAERFVGNARREILDHVIVLDDQHLGRLVAQYKAYFNEARPHQGIGQRIPGKPAVTIDITKPIVATPALGGLPHDYRRAA